MTDTATMPSDGIAAKPDVKKRAVKIYTRYERFWHWSQALLIFVLALSGFNLHGTFDLAPFPLAVKVHTYAAILLILLWLFTHILELHDRSMASLSTQEQGTSGCHQVLCLWHHPWSSAPLFKRAETQAERAAVARLSHLHGDHRPCTVALWHRLSALRSVVPYRQWSAALHAGCLRPYRRRLRHDHLRCHPHLYDNDGQDDLPLHQDHDHRL